MIARNKDLSYMDGRKIYHKSNAIAIKEWATITVGVTAK